VAETYELNRCARTRGLLLTEQLANLAMDGARPAPRVAIVGAGVAGRAAAAALRCSGVAVEVLDKGRGGCGRAATRRGAVHFDGGAQYFTMTQQRSWAAEAAANGTLAPWLREPGQLVKSNTGVGYKASSVTSLGESWVAVPGMNRLGDAIDPTTRVKFNCRIKSIKPEGACWALQDESGTSVGVFDAVLVTVPPHQAKDLFPTPCSLLGSVPPEESEGATEPCRVAAFRFPANAIGGLWQGMMVDGGWLGPGGWIARDSSKEGRQDSSGDETFVVQAGPERSRQTYHTPDEALEADMLKAFFAAADVATPFPAPIAVAWFRWRYAQTVKDISEGQGVITDNNLPGLFYAGANCCDGLIESVVDSGELAASQILNYVNNSPQDAAL